MAAAGGTAYWSPILGVVPEQPEPDFLVPRERHDGPVRLAEPDPAWAAQFIREQERIRTALGHRAVQVEHVGSTAAPELAAKPAIDIVLTVRDSADEAGYVPDLLAAGYVLVPKRELAPTLDYVQDYADAKSAVVEEIISRSQAARQSDA